MQEDKNILSNADLILAKQDLTQFNSLYLKTVKQVFNFAYYLTKNKQDAEDLTSETFLKAINKLSSFKGDAKQFKAWLLSICRNIFYDYLKKYRYKHTNAEEIEEYIGIENNTEEIINIFMTLDKLPKIYKEVLILQLKFGYETKEISKIINKSEVNTRKIISRAKEYLKNNIK